MAGQSFLDKLTKQFGAKIVGANLDALDPWIEVAAHGIIDVCKYLRDEPTLRFNMCNCITAVDYFEPDPKKAAKAGFDPHLELVYHLSSIVHKHSIVVKVKLPRWQGDVEGELPEVASVSGIWSTADWHEREVYDLSGIRFLGHPNLRRILCPEDWVGHPLRKDYEMPLEYHGIRGR
ncbi:MAG: NADH-quinone oxidoreductase subunit C [Pirellulaceae bacterium]|nr:NADH-quinone oxidoreductase subunit C [Planctomycetales bacterium]